MTFDCGQRYLVIHLGMSGIFLRERAASRYPQHIHAEFRFNSGKELYYQDVRKFGKMWIHDEFPPLDTLGIDPFEPEFRNESVLAGLIHRRKRNVKNFLMDQSLVAGIGNIYASEILFEAAISPHRTTDTLAPHELSALHGAIDTILRDATNRFGTTYSAYQTVDGISGDNQNFLKVYQRSGEPCTRCGSPVLRVVQGARSTFYCEICQF